MFIVLSVVDANRLADQFTDPSLTPAFGVFFSCPQTLGVTTELEKKVKTIIVAMLLATAIVSPSNAGNWATVERPCGSKCTAPQPTPSQPAVGSVRFRDLNPPSYEHRSKMTIGHGDGSTSTIRSIYRAW